MVIKNTKRLVIDTSVLTSVSEVSEHSKNCREFLETARKICHRVVITKDLYNEWNKHSSYFSKKWLGSMLDRSDKKVYFAEIQPHKDIQELIYQRCSSVRNYESMMKDMLLIEAALVSDRIIISLDEEARKLFTGLSANCDELKKVVWLNPNKPDENPISWLKQGAPPDEHRMLGCT